MEANRRRMNVFRGEPGACIGGANPATADFPNMDVVVFASDIDSDVQASVTKIAQRTMVFSYSEVGTFRHEFGHAMFNLADEYNCVNDFGTIPPSASHPREPVQRPRRLPGVLRRYGGVQAAGRRSCVLHAREILVQGRPRRRHHGGSAPEPRGFVWHRLQGPDARVVRKVSVPRPRLEYVPLIVALATGCDEPEQPQVTQVWAGSVGTCATTTDGSFWCWGYNGAMQVGDGTTQDRNTPVKPVGDLRDVTFVSIGFDDTCAVREQHLFCWGAGSGGDGSILGAGVCAGARATGGDAGRDQPGGHEFHGAMRAKARRIDLVLGDWRPRLSGQRCGRRQRRTGAGQLDVERCRGVRARHLCAER